MRALDEFYLGGVDVFHGPRNCIAAGPFRCRRRLTSRIAPVIAIRGTRQVGKTEIQLQLIEELIHLDGIPPRDVLRVQFDDLPSIGAFKEPLLRSSLV